jgi:hypothetical protein
MPFIISLFSLFLLELRGLSSGLSTRLVMTETSLEVLRDEVHIILVLSCQPFFLLAAFSYELSCGPLLIVAIIINLEVLKKLRAMIIKCSGSHKGQEEASQDPSTYWTYQSS